MSTITAPRTHAADPRRSERMQKLLDVLADGLPHSTAECGRPANDQAVHSTIHELRDRGYTIPKPVRVGRIHYYTLVARPAEKKEA